MTRLTLGRCDPEAYPQNALANSPGMERDEEAGLHAARPALGPILALQSAIHLRPMRPSNYDLSRADKCLTEADPMMLADLTKR